VGFLSFGAVALVAAYHGVTQPAGLSRLWLVVIVVWFLAAAVHNFEHKKETWLFLGLAVAGARARPLHSERLAPGS
jgi:hypothetical protein